jgi:hypothetical protein
MGVEPLASVLKRECDPTAYRIAGSHATRPQVEPGDRNGLIQAEIRMIRLMRDEILNRGRRLAQSGPESSLAGTGITRGQVQLAPLRGAELRAGGRAA